MDLCLIEVTTVLLPNVLNIYLPLRLLCGADEIYSTARLYHILSSDRSCPTLSI